MMTNTVLIETTMEPKTQNLFPIRTVSSLTGVNSITLRAWEKRYGLITPVRTAKGHRLYTQANIDMINEIVDLLARGFRSARSAMPWRNGMLRKRTLQAMRGMAL